MKMPQISLDFSHFFIRCLCCITNSTLPSDYIQQHSDKENFEKN